MPDGKDQYHAGFKKIRVAFLVLITVVTLSLLALPFILRYKNKENPLLTAARCRNIAELQKLLDKGHDPNAQCPKGGESALWILVDTGNLEGVKLLLEHGADPGLSCGNNKSPIDHAARKNRPEILDILKKYQQKKISSAMRRDEE